VLANPVTDDAMTLDELKTIIGNAGGGGNALDYAEALHAKISTIAAYQSLSPILKQLAKAREEGDFRGRVLEVNFAEAFAQKGVILENAIKQGRAGDVDFRWKVDGFEVCIEMRMVSQAKALKETINKQLEMAGVSATAVPDDSREIARLQREWIQKATTTKFDPKPADSTINIVAVDVSELLLGTVDVADCLLVAGGNPVACHHFQPAEIYFRDSGECPDFCV
jgi:hypothetical protein